jgi:hypothetical protein
MAPPRRPRLGIFGREGADMAIRWVVPDVGSPTYNAFKMYRNYDGLKSTFGDVSVSATTATNPDTLSVFAARRTSDGKLTVMVINKVAAAQTVTVNLSNFTASGPAQRFQLIAPATLSRPWPPHPWPPIAFSASVPAQSITLFVVRGVGATDGDLAITKTDGPERGHSGPADHVHDRRLQRRPVHGNRRHRHR